MTRFRLLILLLLIPGIGSAQSSTTSDPQAIKLAAQAVAALTGGSAISDATLTGTAVLTLGSDQETGSVTLLSKGLAESRIDLTLSGGTRSQIRNISGQLNAGNWIGTDRAVHAIAYHNCFTDSSWFFPSSGVLAVAANSSKVVLSYVGLESLQQASFQHIHVYTTNSNLPEAQRLSATDFYFDPNSFLPSIITFYEHPDNDQSVNISVSLMFSDYRNVSGAMIPFHIQRYINNGLMLDIQLTSATLNSGIPDSQFALQ